ncbi:homeobox expressed in ES cells 1-like isoform X2 [Boleophthalmus pectinirostris]|uniref:homeobox expressed in ES cells 1-like isoform X2 n=2 Tax=Boleophthalmus pectinirostris TaxID=150288 RepID=UPI00242FBABA|nr:homeobox expressed in ES cells 1-like isoform X2 [Boleophthalmus pectinirostris]
MASDSLENTTNTDSSMASVEFSIERILGSGNEEKCNRIKLHRPWADPETEKENFEVYSDLSSIRPNSHWFMGRRPRTAFTDKQVGMLEKVFQVNCYPGIQLREELAHSLKLDEDRIQVKMMVSLHLPRIGARLGTRLRLEDLVSEPQSQTETLAPRDTAAPRPVFTQRRRHQPRGQRARRGSREVTGDSSM